MKLRRKIAWGIVGALLLTGLSGAAVMVYQVPAIGIALAAIFLVAWALTELVEPE